MIFYPELISEIMFLGFLSLQRS